MLNGHKKNKLMMVFSLGGVIRFVWRIKPSFSLMLGFMNIFQGLFPALMLWVGKLIIESIVQGIGGNETAFQKTIYLLVFLLGINLLSNIVASASAAIQTLLGDLISHGINVKVIKKSTSLDLIHFDDPMFYDMLTRAQREASYKPLIILNQVFDLIKNLIALVSMMAVIFRLHWLAVVILVASSIPYSFAQQKYARKGYSLLFGQTADSRRMLYFNHILTSVNFFKEIKLFDLGGYFLNRFETLFKNIYNQNKQLVVKKNLSNYWASLLTIISYIGIYAYISFRTIRRAISLGDLTLYSGAFLQCQGRFTGIIGNLTTLYESNLFISNLFDYLNLEPRITGPSVPKHLILPIQHGITFKNVSFRYPGTECYVLKSLNFHIKSPESIAIVGENGAGKTTIIKLLSRLYDPDEGEILMDGINIKEFDPRKYQELIGAIFQDFSQYSLTASENIGLGWVNEIDNIQRIKEASSKCGADVLIEHLPNGYSSVLGRYFDNGNQLSIGEWQKIAIARAFMRNGKILILDEPTASVDAKTEYEIFRCFKELTRERMTILISHRFSTVRMADRILVLEDGRIIEQGPHADLMELGKKYATMFKMQAENYGFL
jgi:ATP-binding cassette, subfamily B, bacterial